MRTPRFPRPTRVPGVLAVLLASSLVGCSSSDDDDDPATFDTFVKQLIDQTADDTDPVSLDGRTFTFNEDPTAFDSLFP